MANYEFKADVGDKIYYITDYEIKEKLIEKIIICHNDGVKYKLLSIDNIFLSDEDFFTDRDDAKKWLINSITDKLERRIKRIRES